MWKHAGLEPVVVFIQKAIEQGQFRPDPLVPVQVEPCKAIFERVRARWEGVN